MSLNSNAAAMKDVGHIISSDQNDVMQAVPPSSFSSPVRLQEPGLTSSQPAQRGTTAQGGSTIHYGGEILFTGSSAITTPSSYFSGAITPSPMLDSSLTPYTPHGSSPQPAPGAHSYGPPGMQPPPQHPLFSPPSSYPTYPNSLPVPLPPNHTMNERFLLPGGTLPMTRFSGFTARGPHPTLPGYRGPPDPGRLRPPYSSPLLPPERKIPGVPPNGNRNPSDMEQRETQNSRKKRKACGHCPPCQRKENCGTCMNCINRTKGKQICIHRKCEVLKKKPGNPTYLPPTSDAKLEKRKEIDDFLPSNAKRSKSTDNPTDLPQGLIHPTLHPNFSEFGDISRPPAQDLPAIRRSSLSHPVPPVKPSVNENPPFFSPTETNQQFNQSSVRPVGQNISAAASGEADFINQALQAIESNIANPSRANSTSNAPITDLPGLGTSGRKQDSNAHPQQLQNLHQRRNSLHRRDSQVELNFCWDSDSVAPIKLPGQPPPIPLPPGPGPGDIDHNLDGSGPLMSDLQKYDSPQFQTKLHPLKEPQKAASSVSTRRQSQQDPVLNLPEADNIKTSPSLRMPNQQFPGNLQVNSQLSRGGQGGFQTPTSQLGGLAYPQQSGPAMINSQLGTNVDQSGPMFSPTQQANVRPCGQMEQPASAPYSGTIQRFPYSDPNHFLSSPMAYSNNGLQHGQSYHPHQGELLCPDLSRLPTIPAPFPQNMQYNQYGTVGGQAAGEFIQNNPHFDPTTGINMGHNQQPPSAMGGGGSHGNGPHWNYNTQPKVPQNLGMDTNSAPGAVESPTNSVFPPGMPHPPSFSNRRISNTSVESFHNQRHLSAGSCGNNQSPMTQSPASGPSMLTHSPFASGNSVRSPMSSLVAGSPAPQLHGVASSPMTHVSPSSMHNTNAMGSLPSLPGPGDPPHQRNMQTYRPWHEQQDPNARSTPGIHYHAHVAHSVAPSDGYVQKPAVPVNPTPPNHFLVEPGSSVCTSQTQKPYPGNVASLDSHRDQRDANVSAAAARALHQTSNHKQAGSIGPRPDPSAQRTFTETMNSVLYGHALSDTSPLAGRKDAKLGGAVENVSKARCAASPADTHSTISPGESGYDSMDHSSIPGDVLPQHNGRAAPAGSNEMPKNLQAALMDNNKEAARIVDHRQSSGTNASPHTGESRPCSPSTKAALSQVDNLKETISATEAEQLINLPQSSSDYVLSDNCVFCSSVTKSDVTISPPRSVSTKPRSSSLDVMYPRQVDYEKVEMDFTKPEKGKLSLRRFSCQEIGSAERIIPGRKTTFKAPSKATFPSSTKSVSCLSFRTSVPINSQLSPQTDTAAPPRETMSSQKLSTFSPENQTTGCQLPPAFDTPPQTPNLFAVEPTSWKSVDSTNNPTTPASTIHAPPQTERYPDPPTADDLRGRTVTEKAPNGTNIKRTVFPQCDCLKGLESGDDAPYYTHLGSACDAKGIRKLFENRIGFAGKALRIEKVCYTGREGRTSRGCPIAKWILRRANVEEKALIVCRQRPGHRCPSACVVVVIMLWEGMPRSVADFTYAKCTEIIPTNGIATERRCGTNEERTCACQGFDPDTGGASFSFGCSWSMYYNGCKFARSTNPNKFKLTGHKNRAAEGFLDEFCQTLATLIGRLYKRAAPEAYKNQTEHENDGTECRLGVQKDGEGRPFSGVTCCMDFCAHSHKDQHNMDNGTTIVVTLTKPENRTVGVKPRDEQLHVLPLYRWDPCNEDGTLQGIGEKLKSGAVEILSGFRREVRLRDKPLGTCKQRKEKRKRDANSSISPVKRRGRKPQRSQSMEDLSVIGTPPKEERPKSFQTSLNGSCGRTGQSCTAPHRDPSTHHAPNLTSHNPLTSPPPRWPYRRHPSSSLDHVADNLPSIGSIFSPGSPGLTPPATPSQNPHVPLFQFGRRLSSTSPAQQYRTQQDAYTNLASSMIGTPERGYDKEVNPLPSFGTVINHPFHKNFTTLKSEPDGEHHSSFPQTKEKINLKLHASSQSEKQECSRSSNITFATHPQAPLHPGVQEEAAREVFSDSEESFRNPNIGGVAIAPGHGSILIECAKRELHATTSLLKPDRFHPSRISLVFYQHKNMNCRNHGAAEYMAKEAKRNQEKAAKREREEVEKVEMNLQQKHATGAHYNSYSYPGNPVLTPPLPNAPQAPVFHATTISPPTTAFNQTENPDAMETSASESCFHSSVTGSTPQIPIFQPKRFPLTQTIYPFRSRTEASAPINNPHSKRLGAVPIAIPGKDENLISIGAPPMPYQSSSTCQALLQPDGCSQTSQTFTVAASQPKPSFQSHFGPKPVPSSNPSAFSFRCPVTSTFPLYYSPSQSGSGYPNMNPYYPQTSPRVPSSLSIGYQQTYSPSSLTQACPTINYGTRIPGLVAAPQIPGGRTPIYNPSYSRPPMRYVS